MADESPVANTPHKPSVWPWPRPKPQPDKPVVPDGKPEEPEKPTLAKYWQIMKIMRGIDMSKLGPVVFSTSFVLFLAVSGLFAWIALFLGFVLRLVRMVAHVD